MADGASTAIGPPPPDEPGNAGSQPDVADDPLTLRERYRIAARRLRELYFAMTPRARAFRHAMMVFDAVAILYFLVTTVTETAEHFWFVDLLIGCVLLADLVARTIAKGRFMRELGRWTFWIDVVVIVALFGSALVQELHFARVLRLLRVLRSYRLLMELRRDFRWFRNQEEVIESALNLVVFVFITTALVRVVERGNPQITSFLDALYFTVTTLTTTGYGDILATGTVSRLLAIAIMVVGVGLFLRLIQALFRPAKVHFDCPRCGLERHEMDAIHCKHCGQVINIPTEGAV